MKRFYSQNINNGIAVLEGTEKEHCIKVLRTREGESVEIVDGNGNLYKGNLKSFNRQEAIIAIEQKVTSNKPNSLITIACCIPKNASRWELFLEKSTEIGIKGIIPIVAKRSEKALIKRERNMHILRSAFKQSGHLFLPKLQTVIQLKELIKNTRTFNGRKFVAHCEDEEKLFLGNAYKKGEEILILIGPEGDFTKEEITLAIENGFQPISLGESRLRVETAAVVATGIVNWVNQLS